MRPAVTIDHVTITTTDFARSAAFYDAALGALGMVRVRELVDEEDDAAAVEAAAWDLPPDGDTGGDTATAVGHGAHGIIWLVAGSSPTTALHIRLTNNSRVEVEAFYQAGIQAGGRSHLAPRRWLPYRRGEFQAIVADPAGNLIEACCPE